MDITGKKIVFLGDSITESWGASSEDKAYHQILKRKYNLAQACNCGIGGTTIAKRTIPTLDATRFDLYFGLRATVMPKDMDVVFIFGGTNDFGHGNIELGDANSSDIYTFNGALNALITQIKADYPNKPIIIMTPMTRNNEAIPNNSGYVLKDFADAIIQAAYRHNIYLIDLFNEMEFDANDIDIIPDGLHPNDKGHEILAEFIGKKLSTL